MCMTKDLVCDGNPSSDRLRILCAVTYYTSIWNIFDYHMTFSNKLSCKKLNMIFLDKYVSCRPPPNIFGCPCFVISQCYADTVPSWYTGCIFIKKNSWLSQGVWIVLDICMVADLCHFVNSFCRCKLNIIFVFSPRNNELTIKLREITKINKALIRAAKYFAPLFIVF